MSDKLVEAAERGDLKTVRSLLSAGENVNFVHRHTGFRPLIAAVAYGHLDIARLLLSKGAEVDFVVEHPWPTSCRGDTALIVAARNGHFDCLNLLIQSGASIDYGFAGDWTAIYSASRAGHAKIVQCLLEAKAKIRGKDLVSAVTNSRIEVVKILLSAGLSASDPKHVPLAFAALPGNRDQIVDAIEVLKIVVAAGADINALSKSDRRTTLGMASAHGLYELIPEIIKLGGEVNKLDADGQTALHAAADNGHVNIVKLLLKAGADMTIKDNRGETALDLAKEYEHEEVVALLTAASKTLRRPKPL